MLLNATFLLCVFGGLLLGGLLLTWKGVRPRRTGTTPHCRACGYNMTGATGDTCPECGKSRGVVLGERRVRKRRLALGVLLSLLGAAPFATITIATAYKFNWYRHAPLSALTFVYQHGSEAQRYGALEEIDKRGRRGAFAQAELAHLIDFITDPNRSLTGWWRFYLFSFMSHWEAIGAPFTDSLHERIADALPENLDMELATRQRVPVGSPIPVVVLQPDFRTSIVSAWWAGRFEISDVRLGGSPASIHGLDFADLRREKYFLDPIETPGTYEIEVNVRILLYEQFHGRAMQVIQDPGNVDADKLRRIHGRYLTRTLRDTFEIVPRDTEGLVHVRSSPGLTKAVRSAISISDARITFCEGSPTCFVAKMKITRPLPIDLAFAGAVVVDGTEHPFGPLFVGKSERRTVDLQTLWFQRVERPAKGIADIFCREDFVEISLSVPIPVAAPKRVDLVLRSCPEVALRSVGIVEVWDGEIRFDDVLKNNR